MKKEFKVDQYSHDKQIVIEGTNLLIRIDYDDGDLKLIRKDIKKMLSILNEHWYL